MNACTNKKYLLWQDIQDLIGPARKWPRNIRRLFWTKNVKHFDRVLLAAFVYVNGLNPIVFLEWVDMSSMCRDKAARNHLAAILHMFEKGYYYKLYAYNVCMRSREWLDGTHVENIDNK